MYQDLSKHSFNASKSNSNLKTQIRLGEQDLLLLVKYKCETKLEVEPNLESFGAISPPEWHKLWPSIVVPNLTSPPKGCQYFTKKSNKHNLSTGSEASDSEVKKLKIDAENLEQEHLQEQEQPNEQNQQKEQEQKNEQTQHKEQDKKPNGSKVVCMASIFTKQSGK